MICEKFHLSSIIIDWNHSFQADYQIAHIRNEHQEAKWHRNGRKEFESTKGRVCKSNEIIELTFNQNYSISPGKRNWRALKVSPRKVKENGKWCFPRKGKDWTCMKFWRTLCDFSSLIIAKKSNRYPNMLFQMRTTIKMIRWIFQSKRPIVRLHHIHPFHIQHPNMKPASQCHHIHHRLDHQFSINSVRNPSFLQSEYILFLDPLNNKHSFK